MEQNRTKFLILAAVALLTAAVLSWALLSPKDTSGLYDYGIGSWPTGPRDTAYGKGTINFQKKEDDRNG